MKWGNFYKERFYDDESNVIKDYIKNIWESRLIIDEIIKIKPKKILEVGCGPGLKSIFLSKLGYNVFTVDKDKKILELVKKNCDILKGSLKVKGVDAFKLPYKNKEFDVLFNEGFFEHFSNEEINKLMKEFLRVANYVVFSVPSYFYPQKDFGDERLLKKETWERILSDFNVIKSVYYDYQPAWHSKLIRIKEILSKVLLGKNIEKPRGYLAVVNEK